MEIPRTKDGKYELIFPESTAHTWPIKIVDALAGRRLYRATTISPEQARKFDEKYNLRGIFSQKRYDVNKDPEGLFVSISIPITGRIPRECIETLDQKYFEPQEEPVGHNFIEPFVSFGAKEDIEGILNSDSFGNLLDRISPYWIVDQLPKQTRIYFSDFGKADSTYREIFKKAKAIDIIKEGEVRSFLQALSFLAVESVRYDAKKVVNFEPRDSLLRNQGFYGDESEGTPINASKILQKKVANTAIALCEEYLSEMR